MNDEQKSVIYEQLLSQHDNVSNQISAIKGEDINLNEAQENRINVLKTKQIDIMRQMQKLVG
jgi:D-tyrosyl-tRNA(Tyr) deacylase|tara:strand:- start:67 stop:252 length:186 start_codon:yes stop_codon:yes gene_type:complete